MEVGSEKGAKLVSPADPCFSTDSFVVIVAFYLMAAIFPPGASKLMCCCSDWGLLS